MGGRILVGTASWSDPGFIQSWYPPKLPAPKRLPWYAEHFNLVEVNSTFYGVPELKSVKRWCEQTPEGFVFDVKLHRVLSWHSTKPEMLPPALRARVKSVRGRVELSPATIRAVVKQFLGGIEPLRDCGKLGALLLQLSPAFSPKHHQLTELDQVLEPLQGQLVAVELRNRGWVEEETLDRTRKFFTRRKISFVMVDAPEAHHFMVMPNLNLVTTPMLAYIRAHGRNASGYVSGRTVRARFDHVYAREELEEIAERAEAAGDQARHVHIVFNNNKADYAPRAAALFKEMTGLEEPVGAGGQQHRRAGLQELEYA